jgi:predicted nuclease of restriction endonuclease-like (RecB) superfamily
MAKRKKARKLTQNRGGKGALIGALSGRYGEILKDIKARIRAAQLRAALSVNRELLVLYWEIGKTIVDAQKADGYGKQVVQRLAVDLQKEFPGMAGFSPQNVWFMRSFYLAWRPVLERLQDGRRKSRTAILSQGVRESKTAILSQGVRELGHVALPTPISELPWSHNRLLLTKLEEPAVRLWYAHKALEHGWSRAMLTHHIGTELHKREGKAVTNFKQTLPSAQSDLAEQMLKDPYNFDFLTLEGGARERDLERGLLDHIQKFLLELGVGFAFVGRQFHMAISGQDYYFDLLFYHLRLRCYVVIDLKMKAFEPEFAGKMNFYLSAADDALRHPDDRPSIGLLLCQERDRLTVEYALRNLKKPIGVARWQTKLVESLPKPLKGSLPTVAEIEAELAG